MSDLRSWHDITPWYDSTAALTFLSQRTCGLPPELLAVTEAKERWGGGAWADYHGCHGVSTPWKLLMER